MGVVWVIINIFLKRSAHLHRTISLVNGEIKKKIDRRYHNAASVYKRYGRKKLRTLSLFHEYTLIQKNSSGYTNKLFFLNWVLNPCITQNFYPFFPGVPVLEHFTPLREIQFICICVNVSKQKLNYKIQKLGQKRVNLIWRIILMYQYNIYIKWLIKLPKYKKISQNELIRFGIRLCAWL